MPGSGGRVPPQARGGCRVSSTDGSAWTSSGERGRPPSASSRSRTRDTRGQHEAAARGRGVDLRALAGEHPQAHAASRQVLHGVDQVGEVPAESHVSDRFSPFATQTIPATVHEAPYILDGLLMNETGRRVREQYADTGGPSTCWPRSSSTGTR